MCCLMSILKYLLLFHVCQLGNYNIYFTLLPNAVSLANSTANPRTLLPLPKLLRASDVLLASGLGWSWAPFAWKNIAYSVCLQKCVTGYPQWPLHAWISKRPEHCLLGHGFPVKIKTLQFSSKILLQKITNLVVFFSLYHISPVLNAQCRHLIIYIVGNKPAHPDNFFSICARCDCWYFALPIQMNVFLLLRN